MGNRRGVSNYTAQRGEARLHFRAPLAVHFDHVTETYQVPYPSNGAQEDRLYMRRWTLVLAPIQSASFGLYKIPGEILAAPRPGFPSASLVKTGRELAISPDLCQYRRECMW